MMRVFDKDAIRHGRRRVSTGMLTRGANHFTRLTYFGSNTHHVTNSLINAESNRSSLLIVVNRESPRV